MPRLVTHLTSVDPSMFNAEVHERIDALLYRLVELERRSGAWKAAKRRAKRASYSKFYSTKPGTPVEALRMGGGRSYIPRRSGRRWSVLITPSWAIGMALVIVVIGAAQVVTRRLLGGRANRSAGKNPTEPDVARLTEALDDVRHRLGELEERMDFAERLLAKERVAERLRSPHG